MRRRGRVDGSQRAIVEALRAVGATVTLTQQLGNGYPDLSVGWRGVTCLLEVKSPGEPLTPEERAWHLAEKGRAAVVHTAEEALREIGACECDDTPTQLALGVLTVLVGEVEGLRAELHRLREFADGELEIWLGVDADRYWEAQRFAAEIGSLRGEACGG